MALAACSRLLRAQRSSQSDVDLNDTPNEAEVGGGPVAACRRTVRNAYGFPLDSS